jgi:hypothetical protein
MAQNCHAAKTAAQPRSGDDIAMTYSYWGFPLMQKFPAGNKILILFVFNMLY